MTLEEIERKGEKWQRITYNNLRATNNLGSICNFKGEDLEIVDTDSFTYLLTYSFPCQDLSVAGKRKGMSKGDNTRSGLLWEVERLLNEVENLPQVLLMENVPQVISDANIKDFQLWQKFLEEKGYSNYTEILNAKDYGVAQNRERCFMVSLLGEWNYNFPKPIPLTKTMKDYLEDEVDEKYYINNEKAQKLIDELISSGKIANRTEQNRTEQNRTEQNR
jgi:DNA (cytosine-5)-methyltransferase 1